MPVARFEEQDLPVTATDLLAYNEGQLVQYLKRNDGDKGFDISSLVGVRRLSKSQRDELAHNLSGAASRLQLNIDELNVDELLTRLTNLAGKHDDDSPNLEPRPSPGESIESTPPPIAYQTFEALSRDGLIEDGGRPACSPQELSHILAEPATRYMAILSWLSDDPDIETRAGEIKTVFSRQFARWWNFRKSQWTNRGLGDGEEALSAFLDANKRRYEGIGAHAMVSAPSFNETIRRQWQHMPASRQLPDSQSFSAYKDAVQKRLIPHHFTRRLQLKKNPHQQDKWTNWLEYLNFEKWHLELLTATAESLEQQFLESWKLLSAREPDSNIASSRPVVSSSTVPRRRPGAKTVISPAKELEATQAERDASNKMIRDFIRDTKPYQRAQAAVYYQRHRVEWVVKEARLMETEMSQQRKTSKSNTKDNKTNESKKRRRDDEDENGVSPESQSKKAKGRVGSENAASSGATRDNRPHTRSVRRSARHHISLQNGGV